MTLITETEFQQSDRHGKRLAVLDDITDLLDDIEHQRRQPDGWERTSIAYAIALLKDGNLTAAWEEVLRARTPVGQRGSYFADTNEGVNLEVLRLEIRGLRTYPIPEWAS